MCAFQRDIRRNYLPPLVCEELRRILRANYLKSARLVNLSSLAVLFTQVRSGTETLLYCAYYHSRYFVPFSFTREIGSRLLFCLSPPASTFLLSNDKSPPVSSSRYPCPLDHHPLKVSYTPTPPCGAGSASIVQMAVPSSFTTALISSHVLVSVMLSPIPLMLMPPVNPLPHKKQAPSSVRCGYR